MDIKKPKKKRNINWQRRARRRWPKAEYIEGQGPFARVALCRPLDTITLWETRRDAEDNSELEEIDTVYCGARCMGLHEIVDLRPRGRKSRRDAADKARPTKTKDAPPC